MAKLDKIAPFLWFDDQAEEAASFYVSVFPDSKVNSVARYGAAGQDVHGQTPGKAMTVTFEILGLPFVALNGGPMFKFTEAVSFQVYCDDQEEIDRYWNALSADPEGGQCGWTKDRYGLSWQIVPRRMGDLMKDQGSGEGQRAMQAMLQMKKLDIAALERARDGK